jgi:hypothetical protein
VRRTDRKWNLSASACMLHEANCMHACVVSYVNLMAFVWAARMYQLALEQLGRALLTTGTLYK